MAYRKMKNIDLFLQKALSSSEYQLLLINDICCLNAQIYMQILHASLHANAVHSKTPVLFFSITYKMSD